MPRRAFFVVVRPVLDRQLGQLVENGAAINGREAMLYFAAGGVVPYEAFAGGATGELEELGGGGAPSDLRVAEGVDPHPLGDRPAVGRRPQDHGRVVIRPRINEGLAGEGGIVGPELDRRTG